MRVTGWLAVLALVAAACTDGGDSAGGAISTSTSSSSGAIPPDVDLTRHDVPLEQIYFDTFDGGSVRLSESTAELRSRLLDAIPPIDHPVYGDAAAGDWLEADDLVLGYVAGETAYAFPFKILNFHEIVNDEIDDVPVLVSYCPLCRSAIVYDRRVGADTLSFGNTSALYESDLVMVDRTTGSYWWQVAGAAIVGPLTGTTLEALPSVVSTWSDWVARHPETLVLTRDTGFDRPYERDSFASYADYLESGEFPFPVGEAGRDPRLSPSTLVIGFASNGTMVAYPVEALDGPLNDMIGGLAIVVVPLEGGAVVYSRVVDDVVLSFESEAGGIADVETGSVWDADGVAVSGPMAGTRLDPVPSRTTFWFAFVGAFPDVEVRTG